MLLSPQDCTLFFRLHRALMFFVNQRLGVLPDTLAGPDAYAALPAETRLKVHGALQNHPELIDAFADENPFRLRDEELGIVRSWKHRVAGKFFIVRELKKYTVFLSADKEPAIAYGVVALSQPFAELVGPRLPVMTETVLLPFQGRIIYDSLLRGYNISFGSGIRRGLSDALRETKARQGIVTALPMSEHPPSVPAPRARPAPPSQEEAAEIAKAIRDSVTAFCRQHLSEEYAELCGKLADKLARKRPSPLLRGSPAAWASGIVRTIGWANFLSDKTQTPHMRLSDIDSHFGISEGTGAAKLAAIRKMLKISPFDPHWTLPSKLDDNPLIWILDVNGFLMDIRQAPREAQEVAFRKGLIPYIPADRAGG